MTTAELTALIEGLIPVVQLQMQRGFEAERASVRTSLDSELGDLKKRNTQLELRILELETRPAVVGPQGPQGERGEKGLDGLPGQIGERGMSGAPGRDAEIDTEKIQAIVAHIASLIPVPKEGQPGKDGRDGKDAPPVDVEALVTHVAALVPAGKDGATGPEGRDGAAGRDGRDGQPGAPGLAGEKGLNGKDGRDGMNGKDGLDGLGFDDYNLVLDPMKGWILRLQQGERIKDFDIPMPFFAGNWQAGSSYPKAAGVRWEGHYWWALKETSQQPGEGSSDWQLVVSRGKEGREGKRGKDGTPGRDLTQMGLDGKKW